LLDPNESIFKGPSGYSKVFEELPKVTFKRKKKNFSCNGIKQFFQKKKIVPETSSLISMIRNMSEIKSNDGRGRAFVQLALMEKKLDFYMKSLISSKQYLR